MARARPSAYGAGPVPGGTLPMGPDGPEGPAGILEPEGEAVRMVFFYFLGYPDLDFSLYTSLYWIRNDST